MGNLDWYSMRLMLEVVNGEILQHVFGGIKLCTYFTFNEHFIREKYTFLNDFKVRQAICKNQN
jgi:hypothetical protein